MHKQCCGSRFNKHTDPSFVECASGSEKIVLKIYGLKVHKIEIFFGFDLEICIISLLVMSKY